MQTKLLKALVKTMLLVAVAFTSFPVIAQDQPKVSDLIIDTGYLKDKIGKPGWVIMDVRRADEYAKGHIPGAVLIQEWISELFAGDLRLAPTMVPRMEKAMGEMGIGNESHIIVYGSGCNTLWTPEIFWAFEIMGCNSSSSRCTVQYYDGIEQWQEEGGKLEQVETKARAATFKAAPVSKRSAKVDEIMQVVKGRKKAVIVDARSTDEYEGKDVRSLRGGHIPKAVNADFIKNMDPESCRLKPLPELKSLYKDIPFDSRLITYCHTGSRASYTYLVLRALGYKNVAIYHDGWRVYANINLDLPVENETWFNFTKVNNAVKAVWELYAKVN
jgi:thiosulfate/3-mercaptopyruvate sulfurtransferase